MTARVLRIELRRSDAPWLAAFIAVVGGATLYLGGPRAWWTALAVGQRELLGLVWPLALAAGAWQARRDRRRRVEELLATTASPRWRRVLPTAAAMAVAAVVGYAGMFAAGVARVGPTASYLPLGSLLIAAVGALSLVPAVWLGMAAGSRLPSALTPPLLAVLGVAALLIGPELLFHAERYGGDPPAALLLLPSTGVARTGVLAEFVTVTGRTALSQVLWLTALAASGLAMLAAASRGARVAAVLPAVLGAAVALSLLPGKVSATTAFDRAAIALVCTSDAPEVCVTRVHAAALDDLRGPARRALAILAAKLPTPPTRVVEDYGRASPGQQPQRPDTILVQLRLSTTGRAADPPDELLWDLLAGAGTRPCVAPSEASDREFLARAAAAEWLLGQPPPALAAGKERPAHPGEAGEALTTLRRLPAGEQRARVAALRQAELACDGRDLLDILVGPGGHR
jgi:hypothetical protein